MQTSSMYTPNDPSMRITRKRERDERRDLHSKDSKEIGTYSERDCSFQQALSGACSVDLLATASNVKYSFPY
jgi:hypothetical protein